MAEQQNLSPRGRVLFGLVFVIAGLFILLIGVGVIKPDPKTVHAPLWVIACAGLAFMLAGGSVMIGAAAPQVEQDGGLPASAPFVLRLAQYAFGLVVAASLAIMFSWVAFGPGPREFTVTTSFLGSSSTGAGNETVGRIVFGIGAVMALLFLVAIAIHGGRKLLRGGRSTGARPTP
jgi:hypothetical protein